MKIYAVFGVAGEYSDRTEWPVRAFRDEAKADSFCLDCIKEVKRLSGEFEPLYAAWVERAHALREEAKAQGKKGPELWNLGGDAPKNPANALDPAATQRLRDAPDYFVYAIEMGDE